MTDWTSPEETPDADTLSRDEAIRRAIGVFLQDGGRELLRRKGKDPAEELPAEPFASLIAAYLWARYMRAIERYGVTVSMFLRDECELLKPRF